MNGLGLKAVEPQEWALQQRLAVCRSRYPFEDGRAIGGQPSCGGS